MAKTATASNNPSPIHPPTPVEVEGRGALGGLGTSRPRCACSAGQDCCWRDPASRCGSLLMQDRGDSLPSALLVAMELCQQGLSGLHRGVRRVNPPPADAAVQASCAGLGVWRSLLSQPPFAAAPSCCASRTQEAASSWHRQEQARSCSQPPPGFGASHCPPRRSPWRFPSSAPNPARLMQAKMQPLFLSPGGGPKPGTALAASLGKRAAGLGTELWAASPTPCPRSLAGLQAVP